ncbi:MAG: methyltransferase [Rhodocyclaceae bacterium]|nr:methyltransferase [Rhodocyclaceae bacterium]
MKNRSIALRFARAAASYDAHSSLQAHAAHVLAEKVRRAHLPPAPRILEIGCGTGHLTAHLIALFPEATLVSSDIAAAMVQQCRLRFPQPLYLVMDGEQPALAGPFDLICANLVGQWFQDLSSTLHALSCLLAPNGLLALSLLGTATFAEWRQAHARLRLPCGARRFPQKAAIAAAFPPTGSLDLAAECRTERFATALDFLRRLRALGADAPEPGHRPLPAGSLRRVLRLFEQEPVATYELVYALWRNR